MTKDELVRLGEDCPNEIDCPSVYHVVGEPRRVVVQGAYVPLDVPAGEAAVEIPAGVLLAAAARLQVGGVA